MIQKIKSELQPLAVELLFYPKLYLQLVAVTVMQQLFLQYCTVLINCRLTLKGLLHNISRVCINMLERSRLLLAAPLILF